MNSHGGSLGENYYAEDWWLEYLEGELDPSFEQDMTTLLQNSDADQLTLQSLAVARELVKHSDDVILPEDGRFYDALHARIMNEIRSGDREESERFTAATGAKAEAEVKEQTKQKWAQLESNLESGRGLR